ncbi:MAG TPA: chemotaxis protein CheX [Candidatus Sulfotelmatobacter sp.]
MNPPRPALPTSARHEYWLPTLELAAKEVFDLMLACPLHSTTESLFEDAFEIASIVGLAGELCGILSLRCSSKSAARMASQMLGIDAEQAGPEMWDAVGEICNMVAGNFKNKIAGLGDGCMLSVPTVITGAEYRFHSMVSEQVRAVLLFEGEPIVFSLEIHS